MQRPRMSTVVLIVAGLLSGVVMMILGVLISGGGHGWTSAAVVAFVGVFGAPAAAVAWSLRYRWSGRVLAALLVFVNVLVDAVAVDQTLNIERGMVARVWVALPVEVVLAGVLVVVWQLLPVVALLSSIFSRHRVGESVVKLPQLP